MEFLKADEKDEEGGGSEVRLLVGQVRFVLVLGQSVRLLEGDGESVVVVEAEEVEGRGYSTGMLFWGCAVRDGFWRMERLSVGLLWGLVVVVVVVL